MKPQGALLIVDVQLDFCQGGALCVPNGSAVVPILNKYIRVFSKETLPIFASRDWHPRQTSHFDQFGGTWPAHCVQETAGARFHPGLKLPDAAIILSKGTGSDEDSYSAFQAADGRGRRFNSLLKQFGIKTLFVGGLATDFCVKWSVVDALKFGYRVTLLQDAIKGVDLNPRDSVKAIEEMQRLGADVTSLEKLTRLFSASRSS